MVAGSFKRKVIWGITFLVPIFSLLIAFADRYFPINDVGEGNVDEVHAPSHPISQPSGQRDKSSDLTHTSDSLEKFGASSSPESQSKAISADSTVRFEASGCDIGVHFTSVGDREVATLTILPDGGASINQAVFGAGQSITFESNEGRFIASVASLNFSRQLVAVKVSRQSENQTD